MDFLCVTAAVSAVRAFFEYHICCRYLSPHYRPRMSQIFSVLLRIGRHEFRGQGTTRQLARHNAANRALKVLANIPLQRRVTEDPKIKEEASSPTIDASDSPTLPAPGSSHKVVVLYLFALYIPCLMLCLLFLTGLVEYFSTYYWLT